ncbi:MAG: hypothetical protein M3P96_06285 [Actinomycetota bacterium]|nr:hypothetical protein [Actinomycetota bacterium]
MSASAWWGGALVAGVGVLGVVTTLLHSVLRPATEIDRYARDIAASAGDLRENLEVGATLERLGAATGRLRSVLGGSS